MKSAKILMATCVALLSIFSTSCVNTHDPIVGGIFVMQVTKTTPYTFAFSENTVQYVAVNSDALIESKLSEGDLSMVAWQYNSDEQKVDKDTKLVKVTVTGIQKISDLCHVSDNDGQSFENATINKVYAEGVQANNGITFFDPETLMVPLLFLAEKELSAHSFHLYYNTQGTNAESTVLTFYLRHRTTEKNPQQSLNIYRSYKIKAALNHFKTITGRKPTLVRVMVNQTNVAGSNALSDANPQLQAYEVDYISTSN